MRALLFISNIFFAHILISIIIYIFFGKYDVLSPIYLAKNFLFSNNNNQTVNLIFFFYIFLIALPAIILSIIESYKKSPNRKNKYGYAGFIKSARKIKKMGFNFENGLVFGKFKRNLFSRSRLIRTSEPLSTLVIAPPGTGKTAGIVIPTVLKLRNSMIIHDPKGEIHHNTADTRKKMGYKVMVFDISDKNSIKFNPFAINKIPKEADLIKSYIVNIANIIFKISDKDDNKDYFIGAAKNTFVTIACYLIYKNGWTSITKIRSKLLEDDDIISTFGKMKNEPQESFPLLIKKDKLLKKLIEDINSVLIASASDEQWAGVMGSLSKELDYFADNQIEHIIDCKKSSFTANQLRKEDVSIYLKVKDEDRAKLKVVISMIFESMGTELISNPVEKGDNQITFILDEFVRLGKVNFLSELSAISRGYNLNQMFVIQDYEQISNTYSKEYMSILSSNCAYKILFKQNSLNTAKIISETIGNKTDYRVSKSEKELDLLTTNKNMSDSLSVSQEGLALVTAQDILNLPKNKCLIITQGFAARPVLANIAWYFKGL